MMIQKSKKSNSTTKLKYPCYFSKYNSIQIPTYKDQYQFDMLDPRRNANFNGSGNDQLKPNSLKVTISQHDLTKVDTESYEMSLKSIVVHPEYTCNKARNDIAILELENEVSWTESVTPACLPVDDSEKSYSTFHNNLATVAGWGWTNEERGKGKRAVVLQKADVNVIETEKCRSWYKSQGKKTKIQESQICAGHENGGIDACWADSGGPLMIGSGSKDQMMVVGVVSTGIGCARPHLPGLYTRVSTYIPWIKEVIGK
ncbi:unnamed protein product [Ceutorhynchus assimilis]|uniref:Peptidase S1 domain-containing protein n=1 Tax=Ceutorhynchus assimilis TaxID=467358 RepID=A0A9N9QQE1_9CUCU|nr:unnamed protein product [Ceutorhynchus assimilis]